MLRPEIQDLIEVFDVGRLERVDTVTTELGAHTIAVDPDHQRVYAFLPGASGSRLRSDMTRSG
jgi:hypothetical protein